MAQEEAFTAAGLAVACLASAIALPGAMAGLPLWVLVVASSLLGIGVSSLLYVFTPELVLIGGGISAASALNRSGSSVS